MSVSTRANRIAANVGADLLDETEEFLSRFIAYPTEHARVAHVLWTAHTHRMDAWESTPRIFFESPEPGSGKSRALEVTELLVPRPVHAVNTTPAYLFRKVSDEAGLPTILYDEIDTVFGPRAKENEDVRGMLNAGHRKGAVAGRCVVRGKTVEVEELPAYCAVALAGLNDLPDTLMSRAVVIHMRRRSPTEMIEPFRHRIHRATGNAIRDGLAAWAASIPVDSWPEMPEGIEDRNADVWEALLAVADAAGDDWPERARRAAVALVAASKAAPPSLGIRLLDDLRSVFGEREHLSTEEILAALVALEDAPWADLRGKPLDARSLARRLARYEVKPRTVRIGDRTSKGYSRADLFDPWSRYLPAVSEVTDVTATYVGSPRGSETDPVTVGQSPIANVTSVTPSQATFDDAPPIDDEDLDSLFAETDQ
ncbi:MAG: DUF3631 domain-containing protein [Acidimicrobiales bacterium]|jgi:hypothetical protein